MNATTTTITWQEDNQRYLSAALDVVRHRLERHVATTREGREHVSSTRARDALYGVRPIAI